MKSSHRGVLHSRKGAGRLFLAYAYGSCPASQARFKNRVALVPEIDHDAFRCNAVVDWVDLHLRTESRTQWKPVRATILETIGRSCLVKPTFGDQYHDFTIRVQDPAFCELRAIERAVSNRWDLSEQVQVGRFEISVDFYPKSFDRVLLAKMAAVLARHHLPSRLVEMNVGEGPRFVWGSGHRWDGVLPRMRNGLALALDHRAYDNSSIRPPAHDATFYSGREHSAVQWRIMVKEIDRQNRAAGTCLRLEDVDKRARIEVTLGREEVRRLGIRTISDFTNFRFQKMQRRYFHFAAPTFPDLAAPATPIEFVHSKLDDLRLQRFLLAGVVGLRDMDRARVELMKENRKQMKRVLGRPLRTIDRSGTGAGLTMMSYDDLNRRGAIALGNLSRKACAGSD
ncbi:MAG: hypothetical protein CL535_17395 [Ahrensia sp.]|nr:hypothetical protein [Ahrensia sp.]